MERMPTIPILPLGSIGPQLQKFMEQIKVHGIQTSQVKASLSADPERLDHRRRRPNESVDDLGGCLGSNGRAEGKHPVFVLGRECVGVGGDEALDEVEGRVVHDGDEEREGIVGGTDGGGDGGVGYEEFLGSVPSGGGER